MTYAVTPAMTAAMSASHGHQSRSWLDSLATITPTGGVEVAVDVGGVVVAGGLDGGAVVGEVGVDCGVEGAGDGVAAGVVGATGVGVDTGVVGRALAELVGEPGTVAAGVTGGEVGAAGEVGTDGERVGSDGRVRSTVGLLVASGRPSPSPQAASRQTLSMAVAVSAPRRKDGRWVDLARERRPLSRTNIAAPLATNSGGLRITAASTIGGRWCGLPLDLIAAGMRSALAGGPSVLSDTTESHPLTGPVVPGL